VIEQIPSGKKPFLYVVVCAAGVAGDVGTLITAAQKQPRRRRDRGPGRLSDPLGLAHAQ